MIAPDPQLAQVASGPSAEVEELLAALAADRPAVHAEALPADLVSALRGIQRDPAGTAEMVLGAPFAHSIHRFTLARTGVLRRSRGSSDREEIAVHPTPTLPGALLRLAAIAPVEALDEGVVLELPEGTLSALLSADRTARTGAWSQLTTAAEVLPAPHREDLEQAAPRAARLTRIRPEGVRSGTVVMLRGRYLVPGDGAADVLRGTSSTGAARALLSALLRP